jgi:hypothetical protein
MVVGEVTARVLGEEVLRVQGEGSWDVGREVVAVSGGGGVGEEWGGIVGEWRRQWGM